MLSSNRIFYFPLIFISALMSFLALNCTGDQTGVLISDSSLEAAIRNAIGKVNGPITKSDLAGIQTLDADNCGIQSIEGLQYCLNLTDLDLHDNNITNIRQLANLNQLKYLKLQYNSITDLSPIRNCHALEGLMLRYNRISDISALQNLPNLMYIYLDSNNITSIKPLAENANFSHGDRLSIALNPLDSESMNNYLPALRSRGVDIIHEP